MYTWNEIQERMIYANLHIISSEYIQSIVYVYMRDKHSLNT